MTTCNTPNFDAVLALYHGEKATLHRGLELDIVRALRECELRVRAAFGLDARFTIEISGRDEPALWAVVETHLDVPEAQRRYDSVLDWWCAEPLCARADIGIELRPGPRCTHEGIGLPGCAVCDPRTFIARRDAIRAE